MGEKNYIFEGEWVWTDGVDSLWVEFYKRPEVMQVNLPDSFNYIPFEGRYNLYSNDTLVTGEYIESMMKGESMIHGIFADDSKTQEVRVADRPGFWRDIFIVNITAIDKKRLKWELSDKEYIGGVRVWFEEDGPKPERIPGFKLPNNIVLKRLKE